MENFIKKLTRIIVLLRGKMIEGHPNLPEPIT